MTASSSGIRESGMDGFYMVKIKPALRQTYIARDDKAKSNNQILHA